MPVDGSAELELKVDASGNLQDLKLLSEQPPFLGFGDTAFEDLSRAKFIPAFRNGPEQLSKPRRIWRKTMKPAILSHVRALADSSSGTNLARLIFISVTERTGC